MADPTPDDRERSILGGRLLGTKPVADSVAALGKEIKDLVKALHEAKTGITATAREISGKSKGTLASYHAAWNSNSERGAQGGLANGGNVKINGAAAGFGLQNAGLQGLGGTVGLPANRTSYNINNHQPVGPGAGNGGSITMGGAALAMGGFTGRAVQQWGARVGPSMMQSDLLGSMAYNNGGVGNVQGLGRGLSAGMGSIGSGIADRNSAAGAMLYNQGISGNNGSLVPGLRTSGLLNPTMNAQSLQGVGQQLTSGGVYNNLRMFGIRTINGSGNARSLPDINRDIIRNIGGQRAAGALSGQQIQATFRDQNSRFNQSLSSLGFTPEQMAVIQNQGAGDARAQAIGMGIPTFRRLTSQAAGTGDSATNARDTLRRRGFDVAALQSDKQQDASANVRNLEALGGFRKGVDTAADALSDLNDVLRKILSGPLGTGLGFAGGGAATAGVGAAVGAAVGGAMKFAGARSIAKSMRGGGSAAGSAAGSGARAIGSGVKSGGGSLLGKLGGALAIGGMVHQAARHRKPGDNWLTGGNLPSFIPEPHVTTWGGDIKNWHDNVASPWARGLFGMDNDDDEGKGANDAEVTAQQVVSRASGYARGGTNFGVGHCQTFVRTCYGSSGGAGSATQAWQQAKYKHPGDSNPPAGASVFWVGGSRGYGHVAVSAGGGTVYSTDVKAPGKVSLTTISWLNQHWGSLRYVGWSEDNNGIRCKVGGSVAVGASEASPAKGTGGSTGSANASAGGGSMVGTYGSINEADAVSGALAGFAGGTVAGAAGAQSAEGDTSGPGVSAVGGGSARAIVQRMAAQRGWTGAQWAALDHIVSKESGWNPKAHNPNSSAAGLFQKMTSIHGALEGSVQGQAKWGLNYIEDRYGNPVKAWNYWQSHHSYAKGAFNIEDDQKATVHKGEMIIPERQAEEIRRSLLNPLGRGPATGAGVRVEFAPGSIVFKGQVGKDADAKKFAKEIVTMITEDDRLVKMGTGR